MEPEKFYIFSLTFNGWVSRTHVGTSIIDHAMQFTLAEALRYCSIRFEDEHRCFPVSVSHITALTESANGAR